MNIGIRLTQLAKALANKEVMLGRRNRHLANIAMSKVQPHTILTDATTQTLIAELAMIHAAVSDDELERMATPACTNPAPSKGQIPEAC